MARRDDLDMAKGFAILLVVFGHLVARQDPAGVHWYEPLRRAVYAFHMPFFLYLSGYAAALSGALLRRGNARTYAAARARRLLLPFLVLGLAVIFGKILAAHAMFVDNAPSGLLPGLNGLLWHTAESPALSVWYLFVLFVVSLASRFALDGKAARWPALLAASLVLYGLPLPAYAYVDRVGTYAPFFILGTGAGLYAAAWERFMDRAWPFLMACFLACIVCVALGGKAWPEKSILLPAGALSMPALHGALRGLDADLPRRVLLFFGRHCFPIYLFNTLFIGLAKGVLLHFCDWNGVHFLPFAGALMAAGLAGPILLARSIVPGMVIPGIKRRVELRIFKA